MGKSGWMEFHCACTATTVVELSQGFWSSVPTQNSKLQTPDQAFVVLLDRRGDEHSSTASGVIMHARLERTKKRCAFASCLRHHARNNSIIVPYWPYSFQRPPRIYHVYTIELITQPPGTTTLYSAHWLTTATASWLSFFGQLALNCSRVSTDLFFINKSALLPNKRTRLS